MRVSVRFLKPGPVKWRRVSRSVDSEQVVEVEADTSVATLRRLLLGDEIRVGRLYLLHATSRTCLPDTALLRDLAPPEAGDVAVFATWRCASQ